jgi:hypothetical protein
MRADRVLTTLRDLERFLRAHGVRYAQVVKSLITRLEESGSESNEKAFIGARELFGGAGSLNDVCISKANGHIVEDEDIANEKLDTLREKLWKELDQAQSSSR